MLMWLIAYMYLQTIRDNLKSRPTSSVCEVTKGFSTAVFDPVFAVTENTRDMPRPLLAFDTFLATMDMIRDWWVACFLCWIWVYWILTEEDESSSSKTASG
jgi:hypothetical protein